MLYEHMYCINFCISENYSVCAMIKDKSFQKNRLISGEQAEKLFEQFKNIFEGENKTNEYEHNKY